MMNEILMCMLEDQKDYLVLTTGSKEFHSINYKRFNNIIVASLIPADNSEHFNLWFDMYRLKELSMFSDLKMAEITLGDFESYLLGIHSLCCDRKYSDLFYNFFGRLHNDSLELREMVDGIHYAKRAYYEYSNAIAIFSKKGDKITVTLYGAEFEAPQAIWFNLSETLKLPEFHGFQTPYEEISLDQLEDIEMEVYSEYAMLVEPKEEAKDICGYLGDIFA